MNETTERWQANQDFYDYLRQQFSEVESAKRWARQWFNDQEQGRPLPGWGPCTSRAMAAHVSNALEGKLHGAESSGLTNYLSTIHGQEIAYAMWGVEDLD